MISNKTFLIMKTDVGEIVGDTSTAFLTKIGKRINERYRDAFRRYQWSQTFTTATINTVAGTQSYDLPSDFGEVVYVFDSTNKVPLGQAPETAIWADTGLTGNSAYYDTAEVNTTTSRRVLRLFYTPAATVALLVRYKKAYTPLSADADAPIVDLCDEIARGAEADAWRMKRQFMKAQAVEGQYETMLTQRIFQEEQNKDISINSIPYSRADNA
jgi:hypothetical protein